jgi:Glycosyl hydrolases family 2, TIM barrel domain
VWQDMPSGRNATPESREEFGSELQRVVNALRDHPSIVMWVPFNEGWGQYDTERIVAWIEARDPSRLVDNASGWTDTGVGDVVDVHRYPGPGAPPTESSRAAVLGEFGGLGLPLPDHTWQGQANWSYRGFTTGRELTDAYVDLMHRLHPLLGSPGLSAAVYTQTTDVEIEVNGLMTYDRAVIKPDASRVRSATLDLFTSPPMMTRVVATARDAPVDWHHTFAAPEGRWMNEGYDDGAWAVGPGGFGTRNTPGSMVRTTWDTPDIWMRRTFELPAGFSATNPHLYLHHDEDAEVYLNGVLAVAIRGYSTDYELVPLTVESRAALRSGPNTIAVHCHQTSGGQYIDVGLIDLVPTSGR